MIFICLEVLLFTGEKLIYIFSAMWFMNIYYNKCHLCKELGFSSKLLRLKSVNQIKKI